ncbi:flagellar basal body-associated FliL family protein [uncultured Roseovarius sp.]|uniref:flagellar basal body-associated FliL family protein n=1 Tax=uncultured Roseovarius sp. TaxID=293344 RepID=UPI002624D277|nr:flagellar basal body-associated FliL family protein [uncultured Roseovarius sp.]
MAEVEENGDEPPKKKSKLPLVLGLVLAIAGGGGGFYAVQSGMLFGSDSQDEATKHDVPEMAVDMPDVAFVPIDPLVVSLGKGSDSGHLRFRAQLEVGPIYKEEVEKLMPRVVDVLNSYLRALKPGDLESSSVLVRLRAQMLRRIQIVTGSGRVNDLLIMEFVLN